MSFFGRFTPSDNYFFPLAYNANYGPIDFEFFGDRLVFTIPFINPLSRYVYSFDSSQNILDKFEEPTLYQGIDNRYRAVTEIMASDMACLYVKDPTSPEDRIIVMTNVPIQTINSFWNAYNIYPINISLLGINQVKDIDFTVNDPNLGATDEYSYSREYDVSTYNLQVGTNEFIPVTVQGSFVIKSGTGTKLQGNSTSAYVTGTLMNTFDSSIIINATTPTILTYAVLDGAYNYAVSGGSSDVSLADYYVSNSYLKYGLTVPYVSKWVGLGNDCRNNPMRLFLSGSTNFIPTETQFTQELTYPSFKYLSSGDRSWEDYIFYDINDVIFDPTSSTYMTLKDAMFLYPDEDYFSKLVHTNYNVDGTKTRTSICYYNTYKNSIDVIFLGLNLSIKAESIASSGIDIKNYDRYKFAFISTASKNRSSNRPIELIINENTQTILMVWYQGSDELNYNMRYSSSLPGKGLMDSSEGGFISNSDNAQYCFIKSPFIVNNSTIQKTIYNIYGKDSTYSSSYAVRYAQVNNNLNMFKSVWNTFGDNTIVGNTFGLDDTKAFETFSQYVNYGYSQNANTFGDYVINNGYQYATNQNKFKFNTTNYETLQYLLETSRSYVMYYILRGDEIISSLDFGSIVNPMSVTINPPRTYAEVTTYNGWYKPKFTNILEFKSNEDTEIINVTERDFTMSNTNLRLANNITQLWYNKVDSIVTALDVSNGNSISFVPDYNVFQSIWDANYYIKDDAAVNGYENPEELSAFFGSKLPKLPDSITLEKWNNTTASHTSSNSSVYISLNVTRAILMFFTSNSAFLSNWVSFNNSNNAITNYVKSTILNYYNISQPKIMLNYFYKPYDGRVLHLTDDGGFTNDSKQNFNGQLAFINDEYIYNIEIPKTGNFSYFVSLTLTEK